MDSGPRWIVSIPGAQFRVTNYFADNVGELVDWMSQWAGNAKFEVYDAEMILHYEIRFNSVPSITHLSDMDVQG